MSKGTVLVTGASGHIGSHVVNQLTKNGYIVRGTVRNPKDEKKGGIPKENQSKYSII